MTRPVLSAAPLGFVWDTADPFLFCVHHDDAYPRGDERMAPVADLSGRDLGQDFAGKDGFRMYHGRVVPGFPQHPHRGFETVTILRKGYIDHSDSMGATARFGPGDLQWMTAGKGVVHSEMFPMLERQQPNPLELFQIWLNLPAKDKLVEPHFSMTWAETVPVRVVPDEQGRPTVVTLYAGALGADQGPPPAPRSWAARPENHVTIAEVKIPPHGRYTLPPAGAPGAVRTLYLFTGGPAIVAGSPFRPKVGLKLEADLPVPIEAGPAGAELLLLQGRPIREPVAQHGPFVMNHRAEIVQAFEDYQRTRFGGWPWPKDDPVHARDSGRFARHADGRVEQPPAPGLTAAAEAERAPSPR
jgi:redox-sensitive bicupin YhaK (pirin superfamily)